MCYLFLGWPLLTGLIISTENMPYEGQFSSKYAPMFCVIQPKINMFLSLVLTHICWWWDSFK